jgi:hypothetical protein
LIVPRGLHLPVQRLVLNWRRNLTLYLLNHGHHMSPSSPLTNDWTKLALCCMSFCPLFNFLALFMKKSTLGKNLKDLATLVCFLPKDFAIHHWHKLTADRAGNSYWRGRIRKVGQLISAAFTVDIFLLFSHTSYIN